MDECMGYKSWLPIILRVRYFVCRVECIFWIVDDYGIPKKCVWALSDDHNVIMINNNIYIEWGMHNEVRLFEYGSAIQSFCVSKSPHTLLLRHHSQITHKQSFQSFSMNRFFVWPFFLILVVLDIIRAFGFCGGFLLLCAFVSGLNLHEFRQWMGFRLSFALFVCCCCARKCAICSYIFV